MNLQHIWAFTFNKVLNQFVELSLSMAWFKQTLGATLCYMWLLVAMPTYELRPNGNIKNEMVMVSSALPITSRDKSSISHGTNSNAIKEHSLRLAPHTSLIHNDPNYNDPNKKTSPGARVPSPSVKPQNPADQPFALPATVESGAAFSLYYGTDFKVIRNLASDYTYLLLHVLTLYLHSHTNPHILCPHYKQCL